MTRRTRPARWITRRRSREHERTIPRPTGEPDRRSRPRFAFTWRLIRGPDPSFGLESCPTCARFGTSRGFRVPFSAELVGTRVRAWPAKARMGATAVELLSVKDVSRRLRISERTIWSMLSAGAMPRPLRVGSRLTRWRASDLDRWIDAGCPRNPADVKLATG